MNNKQEFIKIATENIKREGIQRLLDHLEANGFYESPASTKYHGSYAGGLVDHSLNVYYSLVDMMKYIYADRWDKVFSLESITIVSLFHDLCKLGKYKETYKNVKDPETGIWSEQKVYVYNENSFALGHAAKSIMTLQAYIHLTSVEIQAIYWHMGAYDLSLYDSMNELGSAFTNNTLAFALHEADMIATYICENEKFH